MAFNQYTMANGFSLVGNLTRDPVVRPTASGLARTFYVIAVSGTERDGEGNFREVSNFFTVSTIGKQAEADARYLKRGVQVGVTGSMRSWHNPENNRSGIYFNAGDVRYMGRPNGATAAGDKPAAADAAAPGTGNDLDDWIGDYERAEAAEAQRQAALKNRGR